MSRLPKTGLVRIYLEKTKYTRSCLSISDFSHTQILSSVPSPKTSQLVSENRTGHNRKGSVISQPSIFRSYASIFRSYASIFRSYASIFRSYVTALFSNGQRYSWLMQSTFAMLAFRCIRISLQQLQDLEWDGRRWRAARVNNGRVLKNQTHILEIVHFVLGSCNQTWNKLHKNTYESLSLSLCIDIQILTFIRQQMMSTHLFEARSKLSCIYTYLHK